MSMPALLLLPPPPPLLLLLLLPLLVDSEMKLHRRGRRFDADGYSYTSTTIDRRTSGRPNVGRRCLHWTEKSRVTSMQLFTGSLPI